MHNWDTRPAREREGDQSCPDPPPTSSSAAAWPAPRPQRHCVTTTSTATSCSSAQEDQLPYERPPLSKEFLAGKKSLEEFTVHNAAWYRDHDVDLRLGTEVTAIDRGTHRCLADGERERLRQVAAGHRIAVTAADDSRRRRRRGALPAHHRRRGGAEVGPVGRRVAGHRRCGMDRPGGGRQRAGPRRRRHRRRDRASCPCWPRSDAEVAEVFADLHREHGVDLRLETEVAEITTAGGAATGLRLGDGIDGARRRRAGRRRRRAQHRARREARAWRWATAACWSTRRYAPAIPTSSRSVTSRPRRTRCSTPGSGPSTGPTRSSNRRWRRPACWAGQADYDELPYFFTDQYDLGMEYVGHSRGLREGGVPRRRRRAASSPRSGSTATTGCWPG